MPTESARDHSNSAPDSGGELAWRQKRDALRTRLEGKTPPNISAEEIEIHFSTMPGHYWEQVSEPDLIWGLETIHGFFEVIASGQTPPTTPFVSWRPIPESRQTRIMLCTWDRHGLLAKAAAAFSAVRLNILQANVFTRTDNVVLDEFWVSNAAARTQVSEARLEEMRFLLEGALSEPPRFASVWACSRHKFLAAPTQVPPRIVFDNETSKTSTLVGIEAADRLGLLYDILQAMAEAKLDIKQARIQTDNNLAHDTIYVTDERGQKLLDPHQLELLGAELEAALLVKG